jgi:uncharacterized protein YdeI (YjbR/CyaY-like superfamily)
MTPSEKIERAYELADQTPFGELARSLRELSIELGLKEELKWGAPTYTQKGLVCGILTFKKHLSIWFYQGALLADPYKVLVAASGSTQAMRQWRFTEKDKPDLQKVKEYLLEAMDFDQKGIKVKLKKVVDDNSDMPSELATFLDGHPMEKAFFDSLAPSHRREYKMYISEAKKPETRERRLERVVAMLTERKGLNDKYKK